MVEAKTVPSQRGNSSSVQTRLLHEVFQSLQTIVVLIGYQARFCRDGARVHHSKKYGDTLAKAAANTLDQLRYLRLYSPVLSSPNLVGRCLVVGITKMSSV